MASDTVGDIPVSVITSKNGVQSREGITNIIFVYPSYFGPVDSSDPTSDAIMLLPSYAETTHMQDHNYKSDGDAHVCFAYPKGDAYKELISIKSATGQEYINDFVQHTKMINGVEYYVYVDSQKSSTEDINFVMR